MERDEFDSVKSYKMHDLMHDLATLVAGAGIIILNERVKNIENTAFHVAITKEFDLSTVLTSNVVKLRSFLNHDNFYFRYLILGEEFTEVMFSNFP